MHSYGNWDDEKFEQVENAAYEIGEFAAKYGRVMVTQCKEKFGTARVYVHGSFSCFHCLIWPRQIYIHKWWPYKFDLWLSDKLDPIISPVLWKLQRWAYRTAYKKAIAKYPHIKEEILCCADWPELLEGL